MADTYGALIHCEWPTPTDPKPATFPGMIWGTNYTRMVSQTVFTLFYAGKIFAPKCIIDGKNIQDYLQEHFFAAIEKLAEKIAAEPGLYDECVIGWDSMNEPGEGMVGHPDINKTHPSVQLKKGPMPSPLEGMRMGMGEAVDIDDWYFGPLGPTKSKKARIDPKGVRLWLDEKGEKERGGGRWGWKRDPGWKLNECSTSLPISCPSALTSSLGSTWPMGSSNRPRPETPVLRLIPQRSLHRISLRSRFLGIPLH